MSLTALPRPLVLRPRITVIVVIFLVCMSTFVLRWTQTVQATSWSVEYIESEGKYRLGGFALNASGYPRVLLNWNFNGTLLYSKRWITWENETVVSSLPLSNTALALDRNDIPHVAMRDDKNLWYAKWNGTAWTRELLETNPNGSFQSWMSLAIDTMGRPHIAYEWGPFNSTTLRYAHWNGSAWDFEDVDSGLDLGAGCRIALNSLDRPRIAYMDRSSTPTLKYARRNDSAWTTETVYSGPYLGHGGFAVDNLDRPHVSFLNATSGDLLYAIRNDTAWSVQIVDSAGMVGWESSLTLDAGGRPHISYCDNSFGGPPHSLKYARWNGSAWMNETVDSSESAGRFSDIKIGPTGRVDIVHERDFPISGVKYAYGYPVNHSPMSHTLSLSQYWWNTPTLTVDATVVDVIGVRQADLYYRFDSGSGWTSWSVLGTDFASPWQWTFPWPDGEGRYEFCSIAFDGSEWEMKSPAAETIAGYDATPPVSAATPISPYWHSTSPLTISATASDSLSGVWNVTLLTSFSSDNNVTWSAWTPFGTDDSAPWSWQFTFPGGAGHYRFHTIATDNASNIEGGKTVAEAAAGYGVMPDYLPVDPSPSSPRVVGLSVLVGFSINVRNDGWTPDRIATISFFDSIAPSSPFASMQIDPIAAGSTSGPFAAVWTSPASPCTCTVTAVVDSDDDITELNESNNAYTWAMNVVAGPITSIVIGNPNYTAISTYVKSSTSLDFSVYDQSGLGIRNTTYTIDGGNPVNFTAMGTFFLAGEGVHTVEWWSLDWAGISEKTNSIILIVDDTPPTTVLSIGEPKYLIGGTYVKYSTPLTLLAADSGVGLNSTPGANYTIYRLWGGSWSSYQIYTTPFALAGRDGTWFVEFVSRDFLNNFEDWKNETLVLDNLAPVAELFPAMGPYTTDSVFTLSATDSGCGVNITKYRIDGGNWVVYSGGFTLSEGNHNISYFTNDMLNNTEREKWLVVTLTGQPPPNTPPSVDLLAPTGGENWLAGSVHSVNWTMHDDQDVNENLTVYVNYTTGGTTASISAALKGGDSFLWTLPDIEAEDVVVNITVIDRGGLKGWDQSGSFSIRAPTEPPEAIVNYKPIVALMFAIILLVAGVWSSKRRPWRGGKERMAAAKAFVITSMPFILAEAGTGILSFAAGELRIPPAIGIGTVIDSAILAIGLAVTILRIIKSRQNPRVTV